MAGACQRAACDMASGVCELLAAPDAPTCITQPSDYSTRVLMETEAPGANCPNGGVAVNTYFDANGGFRPPRATPPHEIPPYPLAHAVNSTWVTVISASVAC